MSAINASIPTGQTIALYWSFSGGLDNGVAVAPITKPLKPSSTLRKFPICASSITNRSYLPKSSPFLIWLLSVSTIKISQLFSRPAWLSSSRRWVTIATRLPFSAALAAMSENITVLPAPVGRHRITRLLPEAKAFCTWATLSTW